jgi:ATP-dependent Clp protease, protease subunit
VRARGLEPPPLSGPGPKPGAYANFATPASRGRAPTLPAGPERSRALIGAASAAQPGTLVAMSSLILPPATAQVSAADKAGDVYQQLLKERIVFLGTQVDDASANLVCAQLLLLAAEDSSRDISLYINSPGGSVTAGLAIYDTMQFVPCDISTVCMGLAASMGQFLLCAGTKGKRFSLPHSRILMHQPSGQAQGQAADIAIQAEQIVYLKKMMAERIAFHTGQPVERVEADSDRDRWFTAQEAKEYGFIDQVIERATNVSEPTA